MTGSVLRREHALGRAVNFMGSWLDFQASQTDVPGFVVAVQRKDTVLFCRAYGQAPAEGGGPLTPDHLYPIGSMSKMMTATAVLQLVERGRLALDAPAVRYAPWLARHPDARLQTITLRDLLRHRAGIVRDGTPADYWQLGSAFPDAAEVRRMILAASLAVAPHAAQKYSNLGFALLGEIVAAAGGQPYCQYAAQHIAAPLGLRACYPDVTMVPPGQPLAVGYTRLLSRQRHAIPMRIPARALAPVAGWLATAADLCVFMAAQLPGNTALLRDSSKNILHTDPAPPAAAVREGTYGLGFELLTLGGRHVFGHGGSHVGFRTAAFMDPADGLGVVVLANAKDAPLMRILGGVFSVLDYFLAHDTGPLPPAYRKLEGRFMNLWATLELVATGTRIVAAHPDDWLPFDDADVLQRTGAGQLTIVDSHGLVARGERVHLRRNKQGHIDHLVYGGATMWPADVYLARPILNGLPPSAPHHPQ